MTTVYLGIGSNVDRRRHITGGLAALREHFGEVACSPVYRSAAVGFDGRDFYNLACRIDTDLAPGNLKAWLTDLEDAHGRRRDLPKFADRTLDIDILLYGDTRGEIDGLELPRGEIRRYAHVLKPLADIAGDRILPGTDRTLAEHWAGFEGDTTLEVVDLDIGGMD